jgi:hypothetical protein
LDLGTAVSRKSSDVSDHWLNRSRKASISLFDVVASIMDSKGSWQTLSRSATREPENPSNHPYMNWCDVSQEPRCIHAVVPSSSFLASEDLERTGLAWRDLAWLGSHSLRIHKAIYFPSNRFFSFFNSDSMLREVFSIFTCVAWVGFAIYLSPWMKVRSIS